MTDQKHDVIKKLVNMLETVLTASEWQELIRLITQKKNSQDKGEYER